MPRRTLVLRTESLVELRPDEMYRVAGGSHLCVTDTLTHDPVATLDVACPTNPVKDCLSLDAQLCSLTCEINTT